MTNNVERFESSVPNMPIYGSLTDPIDFEREDVWGKF